MVWPIRILVNKLYLNYVHAFLVLFNKNVLTHNRVKKLSIMGVSIINMKYFFWLTPLVIYLK
jgi:hypothetical protein